MAKVRSVFENNSVLYECSCGLKKPLTLVYFCRHCVKLRCKHCVSHEVDSQYCQHCLEYIPTIDAKLKKNRCASCYSCPCCTHTLSTKVSVIQVKNEANNQVVSKKTYVLICGFCKWTSKDVGIDDQFAASGGWPEVEVPEAKRIDTLFEYYKIVAQKEKIEKEKKRIVHGHRPGHAIHLLDKYGISASLSPKVTETLRAKLYSGKFMSSGYSVDKAINDAKYEPAVATDTCEPLNVDLYYKQNLNCNTESTIEQRLMQIELQPSNVSGFYPNSKMLSVKRSLRCKQCDHNLSKPEYNPSSIKFKIRLSAYYDIPEIRIYRPPNLQLNKPCALDLTVKNPAQYKMHLSFLRDAKALHDCCNVELALPQQEFVLAPNDDTLDLDVEQSEHLKHNDDSKVVNFRRGNKIGIRFAVTALSENLCKIAFCVKHDFVYNFMQGINEKGTQHSWIIHKVFIDLTPYIKKRET